MSDAFLDALLALIGQECWGVVGGEGTGSIISLKIGARTPRSKPVDNQHLSELVRQYNSAYTFMIYCPWRIDSVAKVVSGSHMSNNNDGPMVSGFASICGQKVIAVTCSAPAFDVRLDFENQHTLVIHCSGIGMDEDECYAFGTPKGWFTVGLDGNLTLEPNNT